MSEINKNHVLRDSARNSPWECSMNQQHETIESKFSTRQAAERAKSFKHKIVISYSYVACLISIISCRIVFCVMLGWRQFIGLGTIRTFYQEQ
jgi:hypothetical protein